jgi:hypothetical protein
VRMEPCLPYKVSQVRSSCALRPLSTTTASTPYERLSVMATSGATLRKVGVSNTIRWSRAPDLYWLH